jgi:hypothetical protein
MDVFQHPQAIPSKVDIVGKTSELLQVAGESGAVLLLQVTFPIPIPIWRMRSDGIRSESAEDRVRILERRGMPVVTTTAGPESAEPGRAVAETPEKWCKRPSAFERSETRRC